MDNLVFALAAFIDRCLGFEGGPILGQSPFEIWMTFHGGDLIVPALLVEVLSCLLLAFLVRVARRPLVWAIDLLKREWRQEWRQEQPKLLTPEQNKQRFISPGRRKGPPIHSWN